MTTENIIVDWILRQQKTNEPWFFSFDLEEKLPIYGRIAHQKVHTASTYSRAFRKLRNSNKLFMKGLELIEIEHNKMKVKGWKIQKTKTDT